MSNLPSIKVYDDESKVEVPVTLDMQQKAVEAHNKIMTSANIIVNAVYDMAISLKDIRDNKLYLAFGCRSFRQYCDEKLQISRAQAYNYINVLEHFGEQGLQEYGHYGIKKLKQIQKTTKLEDKRNDELKQITIEIIQLAQSCIEHAMKTAETLSIKGTEAEKIKGVYSYMRKHEVETMIDIDVEEEMVLGLLETSKKDPDKVMQDINLQ